MLKQDQGERKGDDDTNTLVAKDKNVANEEEDTEDKEEETIDTVSKSSKNKNAQDHKMDTAEENSYAKNKQSWDPSWSPKNWDNSSTWELRDKD